VTGSCLGGGQEADGGRTATHEFLESLIQVGALLGAAVGRAQRLTHGRDAGAARAGSLALTGTLGSSLDVLGAPVDALL
jgi:hypothetical protein